MTEGMAFETALDGGGGTALSLSERIDKALQDSMDRCARCKACDNQVDAVLGVLREVLAEKDAEIARLTAEGTEHRRTIRAIGDARQDEPEAAPAEGRFARVEVKGFRDLGIVRVTESTLAGEAMLRAESTDGAVAEFPASSLHFITWLPEGAVVPKSEPAALPARDYYVDEPDDWDERNPF
jgi:hypothetical protein